MSQRNLTEELRRLQEVSPNCGVVYNGKSAEEWYTLYCQEVIKCMQLERQLANDYSSNAGIKCDMDSGPCACGAWH